MKTTTVFTFGAFLAAATVHAQLKVDFDVVDATGALVANSATESGFESFPVQNQTNGQPFELFRTVAFNTAAWGTVNITIGSDAYPVATNYFQVPRAIARTGAQLGAYNGNLPSLVRDWVGIDSRPAGAGATTLSLTISPLPAGQYELVSYHQDPADQTGKFDVLVNGTQIATNVDIRSSASGENPGAGNSPFFHVSRFTSDGSTPNTISYRLTTTNSASDAERLLVLNAFVLAPRNAGLLVYSFSATPATAFQGLQSTLSWTVRTNTSVSIDLVGDVTANTTNGSGSIAITPSDFAAPGSTLTVILTVSDNNTGESESRSIAIPVNDDIAAFRSNPKVIRQGNPVALSWSVHPNPATLSVNQGVGNVLSQTTNGIGAISLSPAATTTYTLTVDRGGNITQSNVTVVVIPAGGTGTLTNGLVAYWPLDQVQGTKTPDLISGYDLNLEGVAVPVLTNAGYRSNAFFLTGNGALARAHGGADQLPANKHTAFTISLWVRADGPPQDDRRIFAEASTTSNNPLFTFDTMGGLPSDARGASMSVFIRRGDNVNENFHTYTAGAVFDNTWHHVVLVQSNGARTVYIDSVLDSTTITNASSSWHTNVFNTTSFGGIKRASLASFLTGFVDDAAIWKRALSPEEIGELFLDGVNPNGGSLPLVINEFRADFPVVVAGDTVRLHWNATSDATLTINNGVGNVTGISQFGVGSTNVAVNVPTQFILIASRGNETPVMQSVSVGVLAGVTPGWRLLDNFENYQPGPIQGQTNKWIQGAGAATVVDRGGNKVLSLSQTGAEVVSPGGMLAALPLNSLSIAEGQIATLFFRLYATGNDPVADLTAQAGLTDHPTGFIRDWQNNLGPYLRLEKPATLVSNLTVLSPNGFGIARETATNTLAQGKVYNVWINVTNDIIASNDLFSVHVQEQGQAGRTVLFENLRGDRNPSDTTFNVNPTLDKVFFALMNQNQGRDNLFVDDLFISLGAYRDTVPVPVGNFSRTVVLAGPAASADRFRFSWNSEPGVTYLVRARDALSSPWHVLATNYPAGGATGAITTFTNTPLTTSQRFYQAVAEPRPAIWSDDLEVNNGWTVIDNSGGGSPTIWEWGTPATGPGAAHSGTKAFGTDLDGNYTTAADTALRSPVIDLTGVTNQVRLEFWQHLNVESTDYAQVTVLDAADNLIAGPVSVQSGSTGPGWALLNYPLPISILNQPVRIEFRMADADFTNIQPLPGWFIDDVVIRR